MNQKLLAAKAIFPHDKVEPGKEVKFRQGEKEYNCQVTNVTPMEGNKFIVWLKDSVSKIRLFWFNGAFHLDLPDGPEVIIV